MTTRPIVFMPQPKKDSLWEKRELDRHSHVSSTLLLSCGERSMADGVDSLWSTPAAEGSVTQMEKPERGHVVTTGTL